MGKSISLEALAPAHRYIAERHIAYGKPIPLRELSEDDFNLFARNQRRTVIHEGKVCLETAEFIRIAKAMKSNVL
jgi:hypothetical protein